MAIVGRSGSGKTTLLRALLPAYRRALFLDPKRRNDFGGWAHLEGTRDALRDWPRHHERAIARPGLVEDEREWADALCRQAYYTERCAVALDELPAGTDANRPLTWLGVLLKRGREASITTLVCTQRPMDIPLTILSEAEHLFVFDLNMEPDRRRIREVIGPYPSPAREHAFAYWSPRHPAAIACDPI